MKIIGKTENKDLASVYIAETNDGKYIEFVESVQPPLPREKKWVLIVSTLFGCPVGCGFCDAGNFYHGKLSKNEILEEIDYMVLNRFPDRVIKTEKFKIQFARMGDPAFNMDLIEVLKELPAIYKNTPILPSISTIAPYGCNEFFEKLIEIRDRYYPNNFQMQFSIHTTDFNKRDTLIPIKKWDFKQIADWGERFFSKSKKIALNFALTDDAIVDSKVMLDFFDINKFIIKITPVNPTYKAKQNNIKSLFISKDNHCKIIDDLKDAGYDVILSIGELEENLIGSNCGQFVTQLKQNSFQLDEGYTYKIQNI